MELFTQPAILREIGSPRLAKFLAQFSGDFAAAEIPAPALDPDHDNYLNAVADLLASPRLLPERLWVTLSALEAAAGPDNRARLDEAITRTIPCVSLSPCCALDRALELWFHAPEELSQFQANNSHTNDDGQPDEPPEQPAGNGQVISRNTAHGPPRQHEVAAQPSTNPSIPARPAPNPQLSTLNSLARNSEATAAQLSGNTNPLIQQSNNPLIQAFAVEPWPHPVDGKLLLDTIRGTVTRFVVLPKWAPEAVALVSLHSYAFELRDVCAYLGVESPVRRCGKTTLLTLLCHLVNRPVVAANVSSPSFYRAIEELHPTLMIDEADRFLKGKHDLQGILHAGNCRRTAYVLRVGQPLPTSEANGQGSSLAFFSCWCPKVIAQIGPLPDTLADRCIVFRMQRKTRNEHCERLRSLDSTTLRRQCARFVLDHAQAIANARPDLPANLNDRAADIWEPLLALADLAGGDWPDLARQAALGLSGGAQEHNPIGSLLLDIFVLFTAQQLDRMFTRTLVDGLNTFADRPWMQLKNGRTITDRWLSDQLRPFDIKPRSLRLGDALAKGYLKEDFMEAFRRYIPKSEVDALLSGDAAVQPPPSQNGDDSPPGSSSQTQ